jgi:hypothetical protein
MDKFVTMTVEGGYGSVFQAATWEDAEKQAKAAGYKVLDWTEANGENVLVVSE